jgi:hypothetical protein
MLTTQQSRWLSLSRKCRQSGHPLLISVLLAKNDAEQCHALLRELLDCPMCGGDSGLFIAYATEI